MKHASIIALLLASACSKPPPPVPPSNQPSEAVAEPKQGGAPRVTVDVVADPANHAGLGAIGGTMTEQGGAPLIGATVVAESPALEGSMTSISDEEGRFEITNLPPGRYVVTLYYGELQFRYASEVAVSAGQRARMRIEELTATSTGEVIELY